MMDCLFLSLFLSTYACSIVGEQAALGSFQSSLSSSSYISLRTSKYYLSISEVRSPLEIIISSSNPSYYKLIDTWNASINLCSGIFLQLFKHLLLSLLEKSLNGSINDCFIWECTTESAQNLCCDRTCLQLQKQTGSFSKASLKMLIVSLLRSSKRLSNSPTVLSSSRKQLYFPLCGYHFFAPKVQISSGLNYDQKGLLYLVTFRSILQTDSSSLLSYLILFLMNDLSHLYLDLSMAQKIVVDFQTRFGLGQDSVSYFYSAANQLNDLKVFQMKKLFFLILKVDFYSAQSYICKLSFTFSRAEIVALSFQMAFPLSNPSIQYTLRREWLLSFTSYFFTDLFVVITVYSLLFLIFLGYFFAFSISSLQLSLQIKIQEKSYFCDSNRAKCDYNIHILCKFCEGYK